MVKKSRLLLAAFVLFAFMALGCGLSQSVIDRVKSSKPVAWLSGGTSQATRRKPNLRPTFTPTPNYTATPTNTPTPTITPIPTDTPTPIPTNTPIPTDTPVPTDTPAPTKRPPPPPPTDTATPAPPPTPSWVFKVKEQGNRTIQKTSATFISNIVLITDGSGTPIGGLHVMGEHSSGKTYKSAASTWQFSALNGLEGYIKQGNVKFEPPEGFIDGTWNVYVADGSGAQLSDKIAWPYSSDPSQRVWDFIWWSK